jgi:hypothetical protein
MNFWDFLCSMIGTAAGMAVLIACLPYLPERSR